LEGREEMNMIVKIEKEFKDDTVYLENSKYKDIFTKKFNDQKSLLFFALHHSNSL
jgi:hypothetical protein